MNISEILEPGRVLGNVEARSKKRALEILSELLGHAGEECVANDIFENLVQREKLGCTALGRGVAVPHGRSPGLSGPAAAFVKLHEPVDFDASFLLSSSSCKLSLFFASLLFFPSIHLHYFLVSNF